MTATITHDPVYGERASFDPAELRTARLRAGLTQRALASRLAAHPDEARTQAQLVAFIHRAEAGAKKTLPASTWRNIAAALPELA